MTSTTQVLSDILVTQIVPMAVAAYLSISVSSAVVHTALKLTFQSFHYSNLKVSGNGLCQHNVNKAAMLADNSHIMRVLLQCRANLRGQVFMRTVEEETCLESNNVSSPFFIQNYNTVCTV